MALFGSNVEYGLHCLLHLVGRPTDRPISSRDLAEFQGLSPSYVAKLFTRFEKAGLTQATEGIGGGYHLARRADRITVLDVVEALDGDKRLFDCKEIRGRCVLYGAKPPAWAMRGVCSIHAVMIEAEQKMRAVLAERTLADLVRQVVAKAPTSHGAQVDSWFDERQELRGRGRRKGQTQGKDG